MRTFKLLIPVLVLAAALFAVSGVAHADILGFGDFSNFTININDQGSAPAVDSEANPLASSIQLLNGKGEHRSIFYNTPQDISHGFTASFTFQMSGADGRDNDTGSAFILENASAGPSANGTGPYDYQGLAPSAAIVLDIGNDTGYLTGGDIGSGITSTDSVNLRSGDPIGVTLTDTGNTLTETLTDILTSATFSRTYLLSPSLTTVLGGSTAYVGFTTGVGAAFGDDAQQFSNFQFNAPSVPEPSSLILLGCGLAALMAGRRFGRPIKSSRLGGR